MKKRTIEVLLIIIIISFLKINWTESYFKDRSKTMENKITFGCWKHPSRPVLVAPEDNKEFTQDSDWTGHVDTDWEASHTPCPSSISKGIKYYFELYHNEETDPTFVDDTVEHSLGINLDSLGDYYWRVRACDATGCSDWSTKWKITVKEAEKKDDGDGDGSAPLVSPLLLNSIAPDDLELIQDPTIEEPSEAPKEEIPSEEEELPAEPEAPLLPPEPDANLEPSSEVSAEPQEEPVPPTTDPPAEPLITFTEGPTE